MTMRSIDEKVAVIELNDITKDEGKFAYVRNGTCKVIGRNLGDGENANATELLRGSKSINIEPKHMERLDQFLSHSAKKSSEKKESPSPFRRTSDFIIDDDNASRMHAMIFYSGGLAGIIDLASTNGTFVNGVRVEICELKINDVVTIGRTKLKFSIKDA